MPKFEIEVQRIAFATKKFTVTADTIEEAENKAIEQAGNHEYGSGEAEYKIGERQIL